MGLFDRLFGRAPSPAVPASPEALRQRLFDAVQLGDGAALARLCAEHESAILEDFPEWQKVPQKIRRDPSGVQRYGQGLIGIAQCFAQTRNRPELLQLLMGSPADNPIMRWQQTLERAAALMNELDFDRALALLTPALAQVRGLSGGSAGSMQAMALGQIATCHFQSGRVQVALPLLQEALALCRTANDEEGIAAYHGSLCEVHRYLGQSTEAAEAAARYAEAMERAGQGARARRYHKLADIIRRGEPLNRVVAELGGTSFELDELPVRIEGNVRFVMCRNRIGLARATALVERGRELGAEGRLDDALPLFREASRIDPHAPEPHYEEAATLLHLQRAAEAVACYDKVEVLAPGWFHCRAERWLAAGSASGRIPPSAFTLLGALENPQLSPAEKAQLARRGISEAPGVPAFHLSLAQQLAALGQSDEAREVIAEGLRLAEELDIRSRLLIESARHDRPSPERDLKLHEAMVPGGNLVAAAMARVMLSVAPGETRLH